MNKPLLEEKDTLTVVETAIVFNFSRRKLFRLVKEDKLSYFSYVWK